MTNFNIRSDSVDVEQIMQQIRMRIREKRGVDYTEQEIRQLATVKLEQFLDPRGVRSDLIEQYRQRRPIAPTPPLPPMPPLPPVPPPPENYGFEANTIYVSSRGLFGWAIAAARRLLKPILKLFFNPNPIIHVLHLQSQLNDYFRKHVPEQYERLGDRMAEQYGRITDRLNQQFAVREELDLLNYEVLHNLVLEMTRLGIEANNLKMRVESLSSRLEFSERRARSLERVVQFKPEGPDLAEAAEPAAVEEVDKEPPGSDARPAEGRGPDARRRRRRGRRGGRRTRGAAQTAAHAAPQAPEPPDGPDSEPPDQ